MKETFVVRASRNGNGWKLRYVQGNLITTVVVDGYDRTSLFQAIERGAVEAAVNFEAMDRFNNYPPPPPENGR